MRFRRLILALCGAASCTPALADTRRDQLPQVYSMTPTGVNLQSGTFMRSKTDLTIGSLSFARSWRTVPSWEHTLLGGWDHNFLLGAKVEGNDGMTIYADGKSYQFRVNSQGVWHPWNIDQFNNNAFGAELTGSITGPLVFRNQNGDVHSINASRRTTRVDLADGTRLDLAYDGSNRLRTVTSNRGEAIVLDYNGVGRIATACGYNLAQVYVDLNSSCAASGLKVQYGYTATSAAEGYVLANVTDLGGVVTSFGYDTYFKPNLTCMTVPGTQTCEVTNHYGPQSGEDPALTRPDQVRRQVMATGEEWKFFYLNQSLYEMPRQPGQIYTSEAEMTDPLGQRTHAEYENGQLKRLYAPEGLTQYEWNGLLPKTFTLPGQNKVVLGYDRRGNVLSSRRVGGPGSNVADLVSTTEYPPDNGSWAPTGCSAASQKLCNKPIARTDPKTNRTEYSYDPAHGMVLTETGPLVNGVRPQKRYRYEQRYAGIMSSGGTIVAAATPVWLLVEEAQCKSGAAPGCIGTADEVITRYEYGASGTANALRLRGRVVDYGTGRLNLRSCTAYDAQGNKLSETSPRAGLASCP